MAKTVQINFRIDKKKLAQLKQMAREKSYREKCDILYTDLIRDAVGEILKKQGN